MADVKTGLQNVVVAASEICAIDGQKGRLIYRGYDISDLAEYTSPTGLAYVPIGQR